MLEQSEAREDLSFLGTGSQKDPQTHLLCSNIYLFAHGIFLSLSAASLLTLTEYLLCVLLLDVKI